MTRHPRRRAPLGRPGAARGRPARTTSSCTSRTCRRVVNALWARRRRGDADHGPAGDRHQRGPLRRQHPDPAGPGLLPAVHDHRHRRPGAAAPRRWTTRPDVAALPVLRRHLRPRSTRPRPSTGTDAARVRRVAGPAARQGRRRDAAPRRPRRRARLLITAGAGGAAVRASTSWSGPTSRRTGPRPGRRRHRDSWDRPDPTAAGGAPAAGRSRSTSARASRSCTSRGSGKNWTCPSSRA